MKANSQQLGAFWNKKISALYAFLAFMALLLVLGWQYFHLNSFGKPQNLASDSHEACPPPSVVRYNMKEYKFAHPLLLIDILNQGDVESNSLRDLKTGITGIIESKKQAGQLTDASVYVKQFNTGNFITINDDERYHPASMSKVAVMMVLLRESEFTPGFLKKEVSFTTPRDEVREQDFPPSEEIKPGVMYSLKDLIYHSIVKSDNYADMLLTSNMNMDLWDKFFTDLELPKPELTNTDYTLNASEYSRFMRLLYNATYLSNEDADYALSLLSQTEFKDGMKKELPPDVLVSHKFGEFGRVGEQEKELHESGIIYIEDNPVLITIMTKGNNMKQLPQVISEISKYVYDQMKNKGS